MDSAVKDANVQFYAVRATSTATRASVDVLHHSDKHVALTSGSEGNFSLRDIKQPTSVIKSISVNEATSLLTRVSPNGAHVAVAYQECCFAVSCLQGPQSNKSNEHLCA